MITKKGILSQENFAKAAAFFFVMIVAILFFTSLRSRDESREWSQPGFLQSSPTVLPTEGLTGPSKGLRGTPAASPRNHNVVSFLIGVGEGRLVTALPDFLATEVTESTEI